MPHTYEHLTGYEREIIAQMYKNNSSLSAIGRFLNRSPSTISREIRRNSTNSRYLARKADALARHRRQLPRRPRVFVGQSARRVKNRLARCWSPEQIQGRDQLEGHTWVSFMSIYRFLDSPEGQAYRQYLRGPSKKKRQNRKNRARIHHRVMIDERPKEVSEKVIPGHWEGDTVRGPMKTPACVMTMVERTSQFLVARRLSRRNAKELNNQAVKALNPYWVKSITVDNGMEFASHKVLAEKLDTDIYFAHKKCPWQRGLNEHVNRLLRQYFPKGTDFGSVSTEELRRAVNAINKRPRRSLGYRTPYELMNRVGFALVM